MALLSIFTAQTALANPLSPTVVNGQASFATSGNTLTVTNTPGAIINWQGFSISANEITRFAQQSASSAVLNRVISNTPSSILGALQSNGRVFLVNPNGIVFGQGANVDVAGLVASSLNLGDADFLAGRYNFADVPGAQSISNAGKINAQTGGQIYLIAPDVVNTGVITAPNGEILLAAGHSVELVDSIEPNLRVNITAPAGEATNVGQLVAESGSLGLFGAVVRNSGTASADSATMQGGKIVFKASKDTLLEAGSVASATGTTGGTIQALGNQVGIMDGATATTNGIQGGGTILVGGDYQGKNPDVQNAQVTYFAPTATLSADGGALPSHAGGEGVVGEGVGNGGQIIVWSDDTTRAYGSISARGGAQGGDGGFVEVSGKQNLAFDARVDTSSGNGANGTLLLDPLNIAISDKAAGTGTDDAKLISGATVFSTDPAATYDIAAGTLEALSAVTDIDLQASNGITIAPLTATKGGTSGELTLDQTGFVNFRAGAGGFSMAATDKINMTGGGTLAIDMLGGSSGGTGDGALGRANISSTGPVILKGATVDLGTLNLTGAAANLAVTAKAGISQSGVLNIGGTTQLVADTNVVDIDIWNICCAGNTFTGSVSTGTVNSGTVGNFLLSGQGGALDLGSITATGNNIQIGAKSLTQSGPLNLNHPSLTSFDAVTGSIVLNDTTNTFSSGFGAETYNRDMSIKWNEAGTKTFGFNATTHALAVPSTAKNVTFTNRNGSVDIGTTSLTGGLGVNVDGAANNITISGNTSASFLDLRVWGSGGITGNSVITANNLSLTTSSGNVSLTGANLVGTLAASMPSSGSLNFSNAQALVIGAVDFSNNTSNIDIMTTAGNITVSQPVAASPMGGGTITLNAAGAIALNNFVASSFNTTPGPVKLVAGAGGITSNASGAVTASTLEVISGGAVTLTATNDITTLAGSVTGSGFQYADANGFAVGTAGATTGLNISSGDITLKAGGLNSLLTVGNNVQATAGSVTYITDNLAHNAWTTTGGGAGKFVEVKPFTAATSIQLSPSATPDAPGILRLGSDELNFSTPLLKVGNSAVSGSISVTAPVAPGAFSSLSLITAGAITQTPGSTLTIAGLNADGWGGVTLNEANAITNLGGHTNAGNFAFTDVDLINVGLVDVNNGINVSSSGNIALTAGSGITQSGSAILATPGSLTVSAANGINLTEANTAPTVNLSNITSGNVAYSTSISALSISATNASAGNIALANTGGTLNVTNAATGSGNIALTGSGNVTLATVTTSGLASVTSSSGAIMDSNAGAMNISAASISLTAGTGIATFADPLDVLATGVATLTAQAASGNIYLASPVNMPIALISAPGTVSLASSTGSITDSDGALTNIIANNAVLSAYGGIGTLADPIEMQVASLSANNSMAGDIGLVNSASLAINQLSTMGASKVQTTGATYNITLNCPISSGAAGDAIVLAAGGNFINNAGAAAISAPSGRWLVYSSAPGTTTKDGLTASLYQYGTAYGGTVAPSGNGFIYASPLYVDANFSGTLSSVFGAEPTAVSGYMLNGLDVNDTGTTITGTATYTNWPVTATTAAGSYSLQYASGLTASPYYTLTPGVAQTYTVNPAALTLVTAALTGTASKIYDGTDDATLEPGNFLLSGFVNGESANVTKTTGTYASKNAGSDILVSTTLATTDFSPVGSTKLDNYILPTSASGPIGSITPAPLAVSANAQSKVYGNVDPALTYAASGLLLSDTLSGGLVRDAGENAGSYAITQGTLNNPNYTISFTGNSLSITQASLTVTANNASKTYDAIPYSGGNGVTYSGLTNGDTAAVLGGTLAYVGTSQGAIDTGSYVITPGGLSSSNYIIGYVDGNLTITPAELGIMSVTANNASKTYGDTLTFTGAEFTPVGLLGGDTIGSVTLTSPGAVDTANAGVYPITPSNAVFSAGNAGNYTIGYVDGQLTVNPALLTVTADALSKSVGNADPLLSYTTAGLKFTDTAATVLGGALARLAGETAGVYPINQGTLASLSTNYSINYVPADFSIVAAPSTVVDNLVNDIIVAPTDVRFEPPAAPEPMQIPAESAAPPADDAAATENEEEKKGDKAAAAAQEAAPAAETATATAALPVCK